MTEGNQDIPALISLSEPLTVRAYVPALIRSRELALSIARNDLRTRHGGLVLGWLWNLLDPLLMLGVYWLVFGFLLGGRRPENFVAFLAVGIFLFNFVQSTVTSGADSIQRNSGMIRQVSFTRAALPLSEMLRNLLVLAWQLPVVAVIVLLTYGRLRPGWVALLLILLPLIAMFGLGGALLFARLEHHLTDVLKVLPYLFRLLFYGSGVLFPIDTALEGSPLQDWLAINPIYAFVTLARDLTLEPNAMAGRLWSSVLIWTTISLAVGMKAFVGAEHRYGRG
jgi:teichoic acid transport system permease protein